jgi:hypothetical protein
MQVFLPVLGEEYKFGLGMPGRDLIPTGALLTARAFFDKNTIVSRKNLFPGTGSTF